MTILIFLLTLLVAWGSGLFRWLRHRPKIMIEVIPGPTMCATVPTGLKHAGVDVHRTAISLYLRLTNVGSAASSIKTVSVGYHWHIRPFSRQWLRYRIGWFWLETSVVLEPFEEQVGGRGVLYPFLLQGGPLPTDVPNTYLEVGRIARGVVYFEQQHSFGACFPSLTSGQTRVKIAVHDAFGHRHTRTTSIPVVSLDEARKYNAAFGKTLEPCEQDGA